MAALVKITQDGRKLEVVGLAILLDGELEAFDLIEVKLHPNRRAIVQVLPEATHMAGRVALTRRRSRHCGSRFQESRIRNSCQPHGN